MLFTHSGGKQARGILASPYAENKAPAYPITVVKIQSSVPAIAIFSGVIGSSLCQTPVAR